MTRTSVVRTVVTTLLLTLLPAAPAAAAPHRATGTPDGTALVTLRVEGRSGTIFEGPVKAGRHAVTTASGGTRACDGTGAPGSLAAAPGPTATGVLDTASALAGFTVDGTYDPTFRDFFISRIGGDGQTTTAFWGLLLNSSITSVGGCQQRVVAGDEVLFAFDAFSASHVLRLSGPRSVRVGQRATYRVTDAQTGAAIAGATVNGLVTNAFGEATLSFPAPTQVRVKGERPDSIRSNAVLTTVHP